MQNLKSLFFIFWLIGFNAFSQKNIPNIKANSKPVSIRLGDKLYSAAWEIVKNTKENPEEFGSESSTKPLLFQFITDIDSISFMLKQGETRLFTITLGSDTTWCIAKGRYPKANFTAQYIKAHKGKTFVEIPKAYELINVIMAITPAGKTDENFINRETNYYKKVLKYFSAFQNHKAITIMDSLLKANKYFDIKMDSYSYELNNNKLIKKPTYNRIAWGEENTITNFIKPFEEFAKKSNFEVFFKSNLTYYESMINEYKYNIGIADMQKWLNYNFPATHIDCFKIIFSPLVSGNQSTTSFDNNGFVEAQPHVNFPHTLWSKKYNFSEKAFNITRGDIVFTELNHNFENPEFENEKNINLINKIGFKFENFGDKSKTASNYQDTFSCIEEYMNWGLVSLRYIDFAPKADLEALMSYRENFMVNYRGFTKFKEFNRFLVDIYAKKAKNEVVSDLYPQIIDWFYKNNRL